MFLDLLDCSLPATEENVTCVRRRLDHSLEPLGLSEQVRYDLRLAFSEACANAVRHGSPCGSANQFHVHCELRDHRLIMEIRDEGPGFKLSRQPSLPDPIDCTNGGRGVYLMYCLTDDLKFLDCWPCGTLVRMIKELC